ncbi:MAG: S-layer homology domain-containing protein [Candidatus Saganbacteria bacterium]|nr:S-layer homology domain-containing protein [Candidatus Saganbacteria bacterium]
MKKLFLVILLVCFVVSPVHAAKKKTPKGLLSSTKEIKFRDVPDSHWAAKSVYKLVKLGVTQGYPDGTFRGTKTITRFETAVFLSKLADSVGSAGMEKLTEELKSELKAMKDEMAEKGFMSSKGSFELDYYLGNIFYNTADYSGQRAPQGPVMDYRLIADFSSNLGQNQSVKATLDTMDGGFYGGGQDLLTRLIDIQGTIKTKLWSPATITVSAGPGPQRHLFGGNIMPSEYGRTYVRPYTGVSLSTALYGAGFNASYYAHNIKATDPSTPGEVGVNQISGSLSWAYSKWSLLNSGTVTLSADYFSRNTGTGSSALTNFRPSISISANPKKNLLVSGQIKAGSSKDIGTHRLALIGELAATELLAGRTDLDVKVVLAGGDYIVEPDNLDEWTLLGYDPFDRPLVNGVKSIQAQLKHSFTDSITLVGKGMYNMSSGFMFGTGHSGSRATVEGGLNFTLSDTGSFYAGYRIDKDPNASIQTTDLFIMKLICAF